MKNSGAVSAIPKKLIILVTSAIMVGDIGVAVQMQKLLIVMDTL